MDIICFHNPDEINGYLSNWYPSKFIIDKMTFTSMEQYMMYKKAILFNDKDIATNILLNHDVAKTKELGRLVKNYNETYWNGCRQIIVYNGLLAKFKQNKDLKKQLKETNNNIIAECSIKDKICGIGLSMNDPNRLIIDKWKGKNLLGYSLMMVRECL